MAKMKPGQISAKRAYEVADSLMENSKLHKLASAEQKNLGQAAIKNKVGDKKVRIGHWSDSPFGNYLSGNDRMKISEKYSKIASADSAKSVGLKSRADQAMNNANAKGRDMPLPSSEGMMSKIANGLSSLFGK